MNTPPVLSANQMILLLYIDSTDNHMMQGRIYNQASGWFTDFTGLYPMLEKMEQFFDYFQFPQSSYQQRTFAQHKKTKTHRTGGEKRMELTKTDADLKKGEKASFVVHVQFRQNATWQGKVQWIDENREQNFRSTLELIKLIDEALSRSETVQFNNWE